MALARAPARAAVSPDVADVAARIASTELPVLLTGELGSGKSHLARWIHAHSARAASPAIQITCGALPPRELSADLFGPLNGSSAAASSSAECGRLLAADGGTAILKAVETLPSDAQRRLLRLLVEGRVDLGPDRPARALDVRVIATTTTHLGAWVASGRFRTDLYYRLRVVHIALPPLRQRLDQLEGLVRELVTEAAEGRALHVPPELLDAMRARSWPGNILELKNACEQLVACCPGDALRVEDLPPELPSNDVIGSTEDGDWPPLPDSGIGLFELERRLIRRVLAREKGNVTRAAAYLKIPRHILAYRINKYGLRRA